MLPQKRVTMAEPLLTVSGVHAGYLKSGITVLDLTATIKRSALLEEAKARSR